MINIPPRGIGDKTILTLQTAAMQAGISVGEVLLDLGQKGDASAFWQRLDARQPCWRILAPCWLNGSR